MKPPHAIPAPPPKPVAPKPAPTFGATLELRSRRLEALIAANAQEQGSIGLVAGPPPASCVRPAVLARHHPGLKRRRLYRWMLLGRLPYWFWQGELWIRSEDVATILFSRQMSLTKEKLAGLDDTSVAPPNRAPRKV